MRASKPDPALLVAIGLAFALLALALFGERLAPHEDIYFVIEHGKDPRPYDPGVVYPLGSDVLGRDLLSLVLAGAKTTLTIVVIAGIARVVAGVLAAAVGGWWRPTRLLTESLAQLVSAIPATIVALVVVKVFVRTEASTLVFIGALLLVGWAGPYRVIRAELDRVARAPFTEGARAIGASGWRVLWRHQLPHLAPVIAINLSQQIVASLVLVAELGVLGVLVGVTRVVNISESVTTLRLFLQNFAVLADTPEWGGLLAGSRTIEALWVTRWLIILPGVAIALTAVAVAAIGHAMATRYRRKDLIADVKGPGMAAVAICVVALFVASALLPERYAEAREWANAARTEVRPATGDIATEFEEAGLDVRSVTRDIEKVARTGPAKATVGDVTLSEVWPPPADGNPVRMRSVLSSTVGGAGVVEAPLVFAARGIVPSEYPPPQRTFGLSDGGVVTDYIQDYPDDYAGIDVRGKVVLLVRFLGVTLYPEGADRQALRPGPIFDRSITRAIERGAAAVIFVDPALPYYFESEPRNTVGRGLIRGGRSPYTRLEEQSPVAAVSGVPVVVLDPAAATELVKPLGLDLSPYLSYDLPGTTWEASASRDLETTARVEVSARRESAAITSYVGEVPGAADDVGRVLIWAPRRADETATSDVLAALARALGGRRVPFVLVDFDPTLDARENARSVAQALRHEISLVIVLDGLNGSKLRFTTANGELIGALDHYAERAGARHEPTRSTATLEDLSGLAPFVQVKTVLVQGTGGDGDLRADAAALVGYLAGRHALGAPEVPR